jgi:hypothetical protein
MQTLISRDSTLIAYGRIGTGAARALNESVGANRKSAKTRRFVRIQAARVPSRANSTRWTVT